MKENLAEAVGNRSSLDVVKTIIGACNEAKGKDLTILNVSKVFDLSDFFVIVSGKSDRQVQGITNRVLSAMKENNIEPVSVEGMEDAHWVLVDFGEVVVHVFYETTRSYYDIESLWSRAEKVDPKKKLKAADRKAA